MADFRPGYYYLHTGGNLIYKPEHVVNMGGGWPEYFDSPFVVKWWEVPNKEAYDAMLKELRTKWVLIHGQYFEMQGESDSPEETDAIDYREKYEALVDRIENEQRPKPIKLNEEQTIRMGKILAEHYGEEAEAWGGLPEGEAVMFSGQSNSYPISKGAFKGITWGITKPGRWHDANGIHLSLGVCWLSWEAV